MSDEQTSNGDTKSVADIEAVLREVTPDDQTLTAPPADLWSAIEVEALGKAETTQVAPLAPVVDLADRRKRRTMVALASAAAASSASSACSRPKHESATSSLIATTAW